jgi:hypothetical protein
MLRMRTLLLILLLAAAFGGCGSTVAPGTPSTGSSAPPSPQPQPTPPPPPAPPPGLPPVGAQDFPTRCAQPGVLKCVGFDSAADIPSGLNGANFGIFAASGNAAVQPTLDTTIKASGVSSLKFTIPSNSGADTSGSYFTNFSSDLSAQFGENQEFFVQWRQRFTTDFITTPYSGGGGWKQIIVGSGDQPGGIVYFSCTDLETVVNNNTYRGFPQMYNSCGGSSAHGPFDPFEEAFVSALSNTDFKLQNARPSPYCLYYQGKTPGVSYFPPTGNCFPYVADEWMTFQMRIKTGPRVTDYWANSFVTLWIAREGRGSELVFNWGPYSLNAGSVAENQKYGKVWLLPYNTGKSSSVSYPQTATWYDELIISTTQIADPQ